MVNYGNGLIYKLCCKDPTITNEYIGSTCNRHRRKQEHKNTCNNENKKGYNLPVYQIIRENGNFENWDMIILEEYPCESKVQLEMKEREWIERLRPTLNKQIPTRIYKEWAEEHKEEIKERKKQYYEKYKDEILQYHKQKYICECGVEVNKSGLSRHYKTKKHLKYLEELNL